MATRTVDILIRLQHVSNALEQGINQPHMMSEIKELFTAAEAAAIDGLDYHVEQIFCLLENPSDELHDMLEEIRIVEEFLQTDEYGFREHQHSWKSF